MIYLIGSLRNSEIPKIGNKLREAGFEVFDDWYAAGPEADDKWKEYEQQRGRTYTEALAGAAARNVYSFDRRNLEAASSVLLVLPAGKSGHLELGWSLGRNKRGYILLDSPDRWDVMYQFADLVTENLEEIIERERTQPIRSPKCLNNKPKESGVFIACYCKECKKLNAKSLEQAPQQLSLFSDLCGETNQMGEPVPVKPETEGERSGGSSTEIQEVAGISTTTYPRNPGWVSW